MSYGDPIDTLTDALAILNLVLLLVLAFSWHEVLRQFWQQRGRFDVSLYGAKGDGTHDDSDAIQKAIDDACAYVAAKFTAAEVTFPPGRYRVTRSIVIYESCVHLVGTGGATDDWTPVGSCLEPDPDFPDDAYVLRFDWAQKTTCLYGNRLVGLAVIKPQNSTMTNLVHGVFWGVTRGHCEQLYVEGMTGRGLGIQGISGKSKSHDNYFLYCNFRYNKGNGIEVILHESDNWFYGVKCGGNGGVGLYGVGANDYFNTCHFTGNHNNVCHAVDGTEALFLGCNFETPTQHNILLDVTGGPLSRVRFIGCQINSNELDAPDKWDGIHITRNAGSNKCTIVVEGCTFAATGEVKPRHHINLSNAAACDCRIANNFYGVSSGIAVNHNLAAVRCTVNGMGHTDDHPGTGGEWYGVQEEGVRVVHLTTGEVYEYRGGAWRS